MLAGQVLVPVPHPGQFVVGAAAKHGGEHQPKDLAQQFPHRLQSPLDLLRHRLWQPTVDQGLFQGLQVSAERELARAGDARGTSGGGVASRDILVVGRVSWAPWAPPVV